jgi:hypothetical protein
MSEYYPTEDSLPEETPLPGYPVGSGEYQKQGDPLEDFIPRHIPRSEAEDGEAEGAPESPEEAD